MSFSQIGSYKFPKHITYFVNYKSSILIFIFDTQEALREFFIIEIVKFAKKYRIEMVLPKLAKTDNPIFNHNINDMVLKFKEKKIQLECNITISSNSPDGNHGI